MLSIYGISLHKYIFVAIFLRNLENVLKFVSDDCVKNDQVGYHLIVYLILLNIDRTFYINFYKGKYFFLYFLLVGTVFLVSSLLVTVVSLSLSSMMTLMFKPSSSELGSSSNASLSGSNWDILCSFISKLKNWYMGKKKYFFTSIDDCRLRSIRDESHVRSFNVSFKTFEFCIIILRSLKLLVARWGWPPFRAWFYKFFNPLNNSYLIIKI